MQREYDKYKSAEDKPADGKFQSTIIRKSVQFGQRRW